MDFATVPWVTCPLQTSPGIKVEFSGTEREVVIARKGYTAEQIIGVLRETEVRLGHGQKTGQVCRELGTSEQNYYRCCREYGGLKVSQARRLKDLERENSRLKKAVADLTLDKLILKEALEGNY